MESQTYGNVMDPVQFLFDAAEQCGFGMQAKQFLAVALSCLSPSAGRIFHVHLAGPYGSGKSSVVRGVRNLLGSKYIVANGTVQKVTAAAAMRMNDQLSGRGLIFDERGVDRELEALLRVAAGGDRAVRQITVNAESVEFVIEPHFAIVEALLDESILDRQDRSRYLRICMPTDVRSRDQISALNRERFTLASNRRATLARETGETFRTLLAQHDHKMTVIVPFAEQIKIDVETQIRDRLTNHILSATCTVAWLRQKHRRTEELSGGGSVLHAAVEDYRVVHELVLAVADDGEDEELSDNALKLFRLWSEWAGANANQAISRSDFMQIVGDGLSRWQVYRALRELAKSGYATGPRGSGRSGQWQLTDVGIAAEHPNLFHCLPPPDEVARAVQDCNSANNDDLPPTETQNCKVAAEVVS